MTTSERRLVLATVLLPGVLCMGCRSAGRTFQEELTFLDRYTRTLVLSADDQLVLVCPELQGRVMTSSVAGERGLSLGYVNRSAVANQGASKQFNNYGGADRLWLGPEGGPFSLYFEPGKEQAFRNWVVPAALDRGAFEVANGDAARVVMTRPMRLTNYAGAKLDLQVRRTVELVGPKQVKESLGVAVPAGVAVAGYETHNTLTNAGKAALTKATGLPSAWILGMFNPSPDCVVIVPYNRTGTGPVVKDDYFGKAPADRLKVDEAAGVVLFRCDAQHRSKIGLSATRTTDRAGSIDFANRILTIVTFNRPAGATDYVNSQWGKTQEHPFAGDVINSYNDGPTEPGGKALGGFYEIETSSPALALKAGESYTHVHRTLHFHGPLDKLDAMAKQVLGASIFDVRKRMLK